MKTFTTATIVALTMALSTGASSEPNQEDIGKPEARIFGEINQAFSTNQKGNSDFIPGVNDSFFGVDINWANEETKYFAKMSADVDINNSTNNRLSTRDAFAGVERGPFHISFGRQMNVRGKIREATVGIFEGPNNFGTQNVGRAGQTLKTKYKFDDFTLVGTVTTDFGSNNRKLESWELGSAYSFSEDINMVSGFAQDKDTGQNTVIGGVNYTYGNLLFGASYERALKDVVKLGKGTFNLVSALERGKQTYKAGFQTIEKGTKTYLLEAVHDFNSAGAVYANAEHITEGSLENYTIGIRLRF